MVRDMVRPVVDKEVTDRLNRVIHDSTEVRPEHLTFEQKVEVVLDQLEERERQLEKSQKSGGLL